MTLRDDVEAFCAGPEPHSYARVHELAVACAADGSSEGLASARRLMEIENEYETKWPATAAMIHYGVRGLEELVAHAIAVPSFKNRTICATLLATIAARVPPTTMGSLRVPNLPQIVQRLHEQDSGLAERARLLLSEFVLSFHDDDVALDLATSLQFLGMPGESPAAKELVAAISARWRALSTPVLNDYERMLTNSASDEPAFQRFLTEHPQLLDPSAVQVWPTPDLFGFQEPDFIVRRADDTYLVVEIECPSKLLITAGGQVAAEATHAEQQVIDYRAYLAEHIVQVRSHFPHFSEAEGLVVIGLEANLTADQRRSLARVNLNRRIRIAGFDWLLHRARAVAANVSHQTVEITSARLV